MDKNYLDTSILKRMLNDDKLDYLLNEITDLYDEIKKLEDKENNVDILKVKLYILKYKIYDFKEKIEDLEEKSYHISRRIKDISKIFRLFLRLANKNENNYKIKVFYATNVHRENAKDANESLYSCIWVLAKSNVLDKIDNEKIYYRNEFGKELDNILSCNTSCILATRNGMGIIVTPTYTSENIQKSNIITDGLSSDIDCYLYNDSLKKTVNLFNKFYDDEQNININDVDEEELFERIIQYKNAHRRRK